MANMMDAKEIISPEEAYEEELKKFLEDQAFLFPAWKRVSPPEEVSEVSHG